MSREEVLNSLFGIGVDSWNRFDKFLELKPQLKGEVYWYALRVAYSSSDNLGGIKDLVREAFLQEEPQREALMNEGEIAYLKTLPGKVKIYRGMAKNELKSKHFGLSWTLNKEVAEFFAYTYNRNYYSQNEQKTIHAIEINKKEVVAFLNDRKEQEIIYLSKR